jgi:hypothetical protein
MAKGSTVAVGIGAAALLGIAAYYLLKQSKAGKYLLQTTAGTGGTINPNSASGVYEPAGIVIPVTITAAAGYTIGQVLQNGSPINTSTTDTTETYQITMNMNQEIDVTFYPGGQPPAGAPVAIQAVNTQALVWGYYAAQVEPPAPNPLGTSHIQVNTADQNWVFGNVAQTQIQFKVIDTNGNGVSGVNVQVYPSLFPDASKYQGYLIINGQMANDTNPAVLTSNSSGIVTVNLSYYYGLNDNFLSICQDAGLYLWDETVSLIGYIPITVENGAAVPNPIALNKGGHGVTGQTAAMGSLQPNTVIAQIPGTSIPAAQTLCSCGFNIKML